MVLSGNQQFYLSSDVTHVENEPLDFGDLNLKEGESYVPCYIHTLCPCT